MGMVPLGLAFGMLVGYCMHNNTRFCFLSSWEITGLVGFRLENVCKCNFPIGAIQMGPFKMRRNFFLTTGPKIEHIESLL